MNERSDRRYGPASSFPRCSRFFVILSHILVRSARLSLGSSFSRYARVTPFLTPSVPNEASGRGRVRMERDGRSFTFSSLTRSPYPSFTPRSGEARGADERREDGGTERECE